MLLSMLSSMLSSIILILYICYVIVHVIVHVITKAPRNFKFLVNEHAQDSAESSVYKGEHQMDVTGSVNS